MSGIIQAIRSGPLSLPPFSALIGVITARSIASVPIRITRGNYLPCPSEGSGAKPKTIETLPQQEPSALSGLYREHTATFQQKIVIRCGRFRSVLFALPLPP